MRIFLDLQLMVAFALLSLAASLVNGGMGYGYSSISVPLALLVLVNRVINPAYALLEALVNTVMLVISGKKNNAAIIRRNVPIIASVVPGVVIGSLVLSLVAPSRVKLIVYSLILPLILIQRAAFDDLWAGSVPLESHSESEWAPCTRSRPSQVLPSLSSTTIRD